MSRSCYDDALRRVLAEEGGYTNHPSDPGGPTNFGITIGDYRRYVKPNATAADVRAMKVEEAKQIYRVRYWDAMRCNDLPAGLDYTVMDYGVNSGVGRAGKVLRRVCALPDTTSAVTTEVLAAVSKRDVKQLIIAVNDERLRFLQSLRTWPVFGKGWGPRVARVKSVSLQMAERTSTAAPVPLPAGTELVTGKGQVQPPKATKAVITAGGGGAAVGSGGLVHWFGAHPFEAGAIMIGGVLMVGSAVYALNRWHSAKQEAATPGLVPVPERAAA